METTSGTIVTNNSNFICRLCGTNISASLIVKEDLIKLSRNPPCRSRPDCLSEDCLGSNGLWDPEKWHQTFERSPPTESPKKPLDHLEIREESNVVLCPQRRSFQGGCHVASKEKVPLSFSRTSLTSGNKLSERSSKAHLQEHDHSHLKRFHSLQNGSSDWSSRKDIESKKYYDKGESSYSRKQRHSDYKRYVPPNASRKYSDYEENNQYNEESEPEWISYGPKSQSDTIELSGFDGPSDDFSWMGGEIPMDDVPERMKKNKSEKVELKETMEDESSEETAADNVDSDDEALESGEANLIHFEAGDQENDVINEKVEKSEDTAPAQEVKEDEFSVHSKLFASEKDPSQGSRFSRWFSHDGVISDPDSTGMTAESKSVNDLASNLFPVAEEQVMPTIKQPPVSQPHQQSIFVEVSKSGSDAPSPTPQHTPSGSRSVDLHGTDAFNRLIASIRASDKVKEQMQQRNQKIQALQSMMSTNKSTTDCFNLSSIESSHESTGKPNTLKLQLEKQKDAYQQKMRQIEQKQKSSPTMFSGSDRHAMQMSPKLMQGFSMQNSNNAIDERAAATASFAAKLAGKTKEDSPKLASNSTLLDRLYSTPSSLSTQHILNEQALLEKETLAKLHRLHSTPGESSAGAKPFPNTAHANLKNNSLLIAQMLASAGVTEEQLKQLTLDQQEMVITMVQNQFTQKDIGKFMNLDSRNNVKVPETSIARTQHPVSTLGSNVPFGVVISKDLYSSKTLPVVANAARLKTGPSTVTTNTNSLSFLTETSTAQPLRNDANVTQGVIQQSAGSVAQVANAQTRLLSRNLMPVQPAAIMSPVVPLVSPNIAPRMLTPALGPHLGPLVQTPTGLAPPYPALLLQLQQQQQIYANQLAVQQQHQHQAAVLAAFQKQQLAAAKAQQTNEVLKLQQNVQNMRLAGSLGGAAESSGADRGQFNNPLAQWFSSDVLRQSQFPPVSQLTGQQTMKLSNAPRGADPSKQH